METSFQAGLCMEVNAMPSFLCIFGSEGDLTHRKLFPALFQLHQRALLHPRTVIFACSRHPFDSAEVYRNHLAGELPSGRNKEDFLRRVFPFNGDLTDEGTYHRLADAMLSAEHQYDLFPDNRIFYLALPPDMAVTVTRHLAVCGLTSSGSVVFEKPFGHDLKSAKRLNDELLQYLREDQIYRMDHLS